MLCDACRPCTPPQRRYLELFEASIRSGAGEADLERREDALELVQLDPEPKQAAAGCQCCTSCGVRIGTNATERPLHRRIIPSVEWDDVDLGSQSMMYN